MRVFSIINEVLSLSFILPSISIINRAAILIQHDMAMTKTISIITGINKEIIIICSPALLLSL